MADLSALRCSILTQNIPRDPDGSAEEIPEEIRQNTL